MPLDSVEITDIEWLKGVAYPRGVHFRNIIITGPPGSGKSTLVQKLGGWPEEGYIDLAKEHWWRSRILTFRPREVHFGIPFRGQRRSFAVTDPEWIEDPLLIDFRRIQIPPGKSLFFQFNWRERYIFDFQLPSLEQLYSLRKKRSAIESHPVDQTLSKEIVGHQLSIYEQLAMHFHRCGMRVIIRTAPGNVPAIIKNTSDDI